MILALVVVVRNIRDVVERKVNYRKVFAKGVRKCLKLKMYKVQSIQYKKFLIS